MPRKWSLHKIPKVLDSESFWRFLEGGGPEEGIEVLHPFFLPHSVCFFISTLCNSLCNKLVNISVSLSSMSWSSKLMKSKEGVVGALTWSQCQKSARSPWGPDLRLVSDGEWGSLVGLSLQQVGSDAIAG